MTRVVEALLLLVAIVFAATPVAAQTCTVSAAGNINFMTYNPASGAPTLASASVTLTCNYTGSSGAQKVNWDMQLTNGSSGDCNARAMPGTSDLLSYNVYQNNVAGGVWGNTGCGTYPTGQMNLSPGAGNNTRSVTNVLYGQIPTGQFVSAGTYTENLVLTVNF